jgi:tetratricopeptide (TPR) repeat protein
MKQLNELIWSASRPDQQSRKPPALTEAAALVQRGIAAYRRGETKVALGLMQQGIRLEPSNLVLANAYRMVVFALRRDFLASARRESILAPKFPPELDRQPIVFFEELDRRHSTRETKLDLAMSWVDEMLLFPALEIKAPSSVQAVDLLTQVIEKDNPGYVPALFARGLNHLHRPARLVWPESAKTPRDAAAQDIGKCVAIGRRFNAGSARLQASLALSLGDAYVKAGRLGVAHSWWQIAQNLCHDDDLQASIRRRYGWQNEEILDRLEEELDRSRSELEHPMTDLALMWN